MSIKAILFFIIILLGFILGNGEDTNGQKRKWYVIIIISLLILESGLRSVVVGPDTIHYYYDFLSISNQSWSNIWSSFRDAYIEGEGKDPGYLVFMRLVSLISINFNVFLLICALVFFVPLGLLLYRNTTSVLQLMFAFTLYVALFNIVALSGIRQQVATGFCFMAFLKLDKGYKWKAVLLVVLGAFIHISALIFLVVPALTFLTPKMLKTIHLLIFATIPLVIAGSNSIMLLLASFLANDYYSAYGNAEASGGAFTYIFLMEALSVFCFFCIKKDIINRSNKTKLLYVMLPMVTLTAPLISLNGAMIRVGQYFTMYMMLLVPMSIDAMSQGNNRNIVYALMIISLVVLSMVGGDFTYYFFWQKTMV